MSTNILHYLLFVITTDGTEYLEEFLTYNFTYDENWAKHTCRDQPSSRIIFVALIFSPDKLTDTFFISSGKLRVLISPHDIPPHFIPVAAGKFLLTVLIERNLRSLVTGCYTENAVKCSEPIRFDNAMCRSYRCINNSMKSKWWFKSPWYSNWIVPIQNLHTKRSDKTICH